MKQNKNRSKKIKVSLVTSPLIRFKQCNRKKSKNKLKTSGTYRSKPNPFTETTNTIKSNSFLSPTNKNCKFNIVESRTSRTAGNDSTTNVSIVQMPSKYKSGADNILSMSVLCSSETDEAEKFTSLKCLMSTVNEVSPGNIHNSGKNNTDDESRNVIPVRSEDQLNTTTFKGVKQAKENEGKRKCSITVCMMNQQLSTANVYELNKSKYLVVLKPDHFFYFIGIVELELFQGSVDILGYKFDELDNKIVIFSLLGYSHIFIKATENNCLNAKKEKLDELLNFGLTKKSYKEILKESRNCSIFILSRKKNHVSNSVWPHFFENHLSFNVFPLNDTVGPDQRNRTCHLMESKMGCIFGGNIQEHGKEFVELPEWTKVIEEITSQGFLRGVLCGGKSVGKSTLLRYLINKLLKRWNKVLVLDFDLGQCEFTVGGCISVTLVEEPVLGPNFSHLKEPLRSVFLGEVDVTKCPEDYIEGCKSLINFAEREHTSTPWLVNTMGFSRGFGVTLTCGIIQNVRPTNVIQIVSKNRNLNFPSLLEPGFVYSQSVGSFSTDMDFKVYSLHILPSAAEYQTYTSQKIRGLSQPEARNLAVLSYLSSMLSSETTSLSQVVPYMIDLNHIDLKTTTKGNFTKTQIAATMNGNLVAMCSQDKNNLFTNCHGFGVVRGVDVQAGMLFVITPIARTTLSKINCLVKGNINLPETLHYNQGHHVEGHVPYLAYTSGSPTALFAKRDYRTLPTGPRETNTSQFR